MHTRLPTPEEIRALVAFLPRLYADGFTPVRRWAGGAGDAEGVITMPWPEYEDVVIEFFQAASAACWTDYHYHPGDARRLLEDDDAVRAADLARIKTMLTYCVRGERFCDGHWGAMIEHGRVRLLLERLAELESGASRP